MLRAAVGVRRRVHARRRRGRVRRRRASNARTCSARGRARRPVAGARRDDGHGARYRLLETVRQYAAERLAASGESEVVRRRHAEHFAVGAEAAAAARFEPTRDALSRARTTDLDNIRAALRWSASTTRTCSCGSRSALGWCYFAWGLWRKGGTGSSVRWRFQPGSRRDAARARALRRLAYMANHQLDFARARPALEEAMAIWRGDRQCARARARRHRCCAQTYLFEGSPASLEQCASHLVVEAERTLRAAGDWRRRMLGVRATQGGVHAARRNPELSMAAYDEARQLAYRVGQPMTAAIGCMGMASIAIAAGDLPRAAALLREGLAAHRLSPEYMFLAWTIECAAIYAAASGGLVEATRLLGADQMLRRHGGALISIETK